MDCHKWTLMIIWMHVVDLVFMSLSTLFTSYRDDWSVIMKGSCTVIRDFVYGMSTSIFINSDLKWMSSLFPWIFWRQLERNFKTSSMTKSVMSKSEINGMSGTIFINSDWKWMSSLFPWILWRQLERNVKTSSMTRSKTSKFELNQMSRSLFMDHIHFRLTVIMSTYFQGHTYFKISTLWTI